MWNYHKNMRIHTHMNSYNIVYTRTHVHINTLTRGGFCAVSVRTGRTHIGSTGLMDGTCSGHYHVTGLGLGAPFSSKNLPMSF